MFKGGHLRICKSISKREAYPGTTIHAYALVTSLQFLEHCGCCFNNAVVEVNENWLADCCLQSNVGAKNHAVVMPDASMDATLNALVAAGFGAAGQKRMALSTVVFVGGLNPWYCFASLLICVFFEFVFFESKIFNFEQCVSLFLRKVFHSIVTNHITSYSI